MNTKPSTPLARAARRMLGIDRDRTSVEDAARAAYTPTGPPLTALEAGIRALRHEYLEQRAALEGGDGHA